MFLTFQEEEDEDEENLKKCRKAMKFVHETISALAEEKAELGLNLFMHVGTPGCVASHALSLKPFSTPICSFFRLLQVSLATYIQLLCFVFCSYPIYLPPPPRPPPLLTNVTSRKSLLSSFPKPSPSMRTRWGRGGGLEQ